ncbi:MAG: GAF domain-containing sensor histidine kinase [Actinomycetota bacterium]
MLVERIEPSTARRIAWISGSLSVALLVASLAILFLDRDAALSVAVTVDAPRWDLENVADQVANLSVPVIGMLLVARRPRNLIGWIFLVAGAFIAAGSFAQVYGLHALEVDPGSLPGGRALTWLGTWTWPVPICALVLLLLTFPDGLLRSRRWRPVAWALWVDLALLIAASMTVATWAWSDPFRQPDLEASPALVSVLFVTGLALFPVVLIASFVSVAMRFRDSLGDERLQLKWFVVAAAFVALAFSVSAMIEFGTGLFTTAALVFLYASIALAVLKYRLYEIDVVIGRAVVFALLAVFITAVYIAIVVGVGTLVGSSRSPFLSAAAAAVVAVAFQPVRARARRLANRVVYGARASPYEVLSGFTERAAETYSTEDVLPRLVRLLGEGIGASETRVWLRVGSELRPAAAWPGDAGRALTPLPLPLPSGNGSALPEFPQGERAFPVRHGAELLGAITVVTSPADPLGADRERLVEDVAAQTGLILRNVRLIEELRDSRRRIVSAQDERAKTLERNIHDGAQQQLVALAVKQRLAESLVDRDPEQAKRMIAEIRDDTQDTLETLRDLARGIYPPLLADRGLGEALEAQARKSPVDVHVSADGAGRYPQEVESAVYFSCLEALQNVAKYAEATRATVSLSSAEGVLRFDVSDDGRGFDVGATPFGTGLRGMADRMDALGGSLQVRSEPGAGTTISGSVPV